MTSFDLGALQSILRDEGLLNKNLSLTTRYEEATKIHAVREILDLELPPITDLSSVLGVADRGTVLAVRMDLNPGVDNHKKFVVAGLILRGVITGRIPSKHIDTLIDGGNFNSAKALKYYTERFGMKGMYVMSYLFPQDITDLLESDHFTVVRAPHRHDQGREREFYDFLYQQMQHRAFNKNKLCLWHARNGGAIGYPFGREIAGKIECPIDTTVSCLGAGSTLEGVQIPIQDVLRERGFPSPRNLIAEHELCPLFVNTLRTLHAPREIIPSELANAECHRRIPGVPHAVLGPHYDEINPLLSRSSIERVEAVVQYSETDWQATQCYLEERGIVIGNSSAANVSVAWRLAQQGSHVLTVIFEPKREFLLQG